MGKDHKGQRVKGSAKPSSSSRIATLLTNETKNLSTSGGNAFLQAQAQFNEEEEIDPETRLTLKKLAKKDAITKIKALETLIDATKQDESLPGKLLSYYVKVYPKLSQDEHRKVRELGNILFGIIGTAVGRELAPFLKGLMPFLVFSISDCYPTVSSTASTAFRAIFPDEKKQKSLKFAQDEIVTTIKANIQQVDLKGLEEENADFRLIYSSLKAVLYLSENEVLDGDAVGEFVKIQKFLDIVRDFRGGVVCQLRRLTYDVLSKTTPPRKVIEDCLKKETSVEAIPNLWNCFLSLSMSGSFDSEFIKRHLIECCENGLYGSEGLGLGVLPVVAYVQEELFSLEVINSLIAGYAKVKNRQILKTIIEILSYLTKATPQESLQSDIIFPFIVSTNFSPDLASSISQLIKLEYFYKNLPNFVAKDEKNFNTKEFGQFVCAIVSPKKSVSFGGTKNKEVDLLKKQFLVETCKIAITTKSFEFLKVVTRKFCNKEFWTDIGDFDCNILSINLDMVKFYPHKIEKIKSILDKSEFSSFIAEILKFENLPVVTDFYHTEEFVRRLLLHCEKETVNLKFVLRPVFDFIMTDIMSTLMERDDIIYGDVSNYDVDMTQICAKLTRNYIHSKLKGEEVDEFESLLSPELNYEILTEFIMQDSDVIFKLATDLDIHIVEVNNYQVDDSLYAYYGLSPTILIPEDKLDTEIIQEDLLKSLKQTILYCKWNLAKDENLDKCLKYLMESFALVELGTVFNFDLGICSDELDKIWDKVKDIKMKIPEMDKLPTRILSNKLKVGCSMNVRFHAVDNNFVERSQNLLDQIFTNYGDYSKITEWLGTERKRFPEEFQFDLLYKHMKDQDKVLAIIRLVEFLLDKCDDEFIATSACWISSYLKNTKYITMSSLNITASLARVVTKLEKLSKLNNWAEFEEFFAANFYPVMHSQFFQLLELPRNIYVKATLYCVAECLTAIPTATLTVIEPDIGVTIEKFGRLLEDKDVFVKACCYYVLEKVNNAKSSDDLPIVPPPFIYLFRRKEDLLTYYLAWDALLSIQSSSNEFANFVKQSHLLPNLLDSLFFKTLTMTNEYLKQYFEMDFNLKSVNLIHLACQLLQKALRTLPYTVRWWWNSELSKQRDKQHVDKFLRTFLSAKLAAEDLGRVQWQKELDNVEINCHPGCNELIARYKIEETSVSLTISLPLNHPLGPVLVKISDKNLLAKISHLLNSRSHSLAAGLKLWKENLDGVYKDVDECAICFFILHHVTKHVPKLACKTCKKKFHALCLYKWFSTSNKSECPLCRNLF